MSNSDKAKEILEKSAKVMLRDNIQTMIMPNGIKEIFYYKKTKDGIHCCRSDFYFVDNKGNEKYQYTNLKIGDTRWTLIKNYALKSPPISSPDKKLLKKIAKITTTYRVEDKDIGGYECYVISEVSKNTGDMKFPAVHQTIIRKKDFVEIGSRDYTKAGKREFEFNIKKIEFKKLDDSIFKIPEDKTIKIFNDFKTLFAFKTKLLEVE